MNTDYQADLDAIQQISVVPTILDVVCRMTGMGFAAVARVTEERWIACSVKDDIAFGLKPGGELKVETTICHEVRQANSPVVIDNVAEDPVYCDHHTPRIYGIQSYISMPIVLPDGRFFGTLCAIDPYPAKLKNPETIGTFKLFADLIGFHLAALEGMQSSTAQLLEQRTDAVLRDQFIAVLGHDLRNPLSAISAAMHLILKTPLNEQAKSIIAMAQTSVVRMSGLIDNVLDFARGRLGDGITLQRKTYATLEPTLQQAVEELRMSNPDQPIATRYRFSQPVSVDGPRMSQLFSNLLGNALAHGRRSEPVVVTASAENDLFELSVANKGDPIPEKIRQNLFRPFFRGDAQPNVQGLGLGLYIVDEIARAHGGTVSVQSENDDIVFTVRIPISPLTVIGPAFSSDGGKLAG